MALPPKKPFGVPDPPPTPPMGGSEFSPEMLRLAESLKAFRQAYASRGRIGEGSQEQLADLFPLADKLMLRLSQEVRSDHGDPKPRFNSSTRVSSYASSR